MTTPTTQKDPGYNSVSLPTPSGGVTTPVTTPTPVSTPAPAPTPIVVPEYNASPITTIGSTYVPSPATETGKGVTYSGKSSSSMLTEDRKGLVSMLEENNPLMRLARTEGARSAEARGLGGSSLRERASEGAAIASAMPMIQQASAQASSERMAAQQATAQSQISASQLKLQELLTQQELAVRAGDNAAARQLEADIANEQNNLKSWATQADLTSREAQAGLDRKLQEDLQSIDIGYKQWLEDTTFKHQAILSGNQQAANAYTDFTTAAGNILNNPDTSAAQKNAALAALKTGLMGALDLISVTADIDLSAFLPGPVDPAGQPGTGIYGPAAVSPTYGGYDYQDTNNDTYDQSTSRHPGGWKFPKS